MAKPWKGKLQQFQRLLERMSFSEGFLCDARPHPGPLPRGEGDAFPADCECRRLSPSDADRVIRVQAIAVPSPGGEGQGEGGHFTNLVVRLATTALRQSPTVAYV
jgi:hypothetical protein